ncbi:FCD domain-containing protein [Streptomyces sp. NBC_01016]|uniref:FadR/GntR family transcriptional regulator n=1 Tax=Streptomyces sp. NBC_01016 TaxID=2903720 RepID=UPI00224D6F2F|nr:FCD domain-containing protein [Streptomyces sp. NBC_01016]MCX4833552.1 FCD domain-containing protein [Streptomyces sp. NBC_01016]
MVKAEAGSGTDGAGAGARHPDPLERPGQRRPSRDMVTEILRKRIALGGFAPGSRLPAERELAASLGVGRNTVRQAVRRLAEEGLVVTTLGRSGGTRVRPAPAVEGERAAVAADFRATIRDYMEYRTAVEPFAAALAARRGSTADRRALVRMLDEEVADLAAYHQVDSRFHLAVAAAAGNEVLGEAVERARAEMFVRGNALWLDCDWTLVYPPDRDLSRVFCEEHRAIALAVLAGDAETAEARMREHLEDSGRQFLALLDHFEANGGS